MAGNSARRGAVRKSKKGPTIGSGGQVRRSLSGKKPTPKAEDRTGHPAARRAKSTARRAQAVPAGREAPRGRGANRNADGPELLVGRNPVAEALRTRIPATALYVALGIESDERVSEAVKLAGDRLLPLLEISRAEMDRMTGGLLHQGIALKVPPFVYTELPDLLDIARAVDSPPLLVALDGVTDPRNLGAIIRSALAFGAQGVIVPERRAASVTATTWRTSAGAAARMPVAKVTNLVRALKQCQEAGMIIAGLDADGDTTLDDLEMASEAMVVVVGSEGRGLSRLVGDTCEVTISIPMASEAESLNASVAAAVTLAEVARRRR